MSSSIFESGADPLAALAAQDTTAQRAQIAQYSIMRAATYLKDNKNEAALKEFKKALAFDPQNSTAQTYIGKINLALGNNYEAIKAFKSMVKGDPTSVDALVNLGNAYLQDKQYTESEKAFKAAARLDPKDPLADYTLGHQYANTGRLAEAEAQFLKVQKISPNDGNVYYSLGLVYNKQGNYEAAAQNLEKALTLKKSFPAANYELGVAYNGLGRVDDARKQLSTLSTSDYGLATDLKFLLDKPQMLAMSTPKDGGFSVVLGANTPLWMLDPVNLAAPNSGKEFSVSFMFTNEMDFASVTNVQNWSITRANSTKAGYYNNTMPLSAKEAFLPNKPLSVIYNSITREATIKFQLSQNATGDAVIDPSHVVFSFTGKDAAGRDMDVTANKMDGFTITPF